MNAAALDLGPVWLTVRLALVTVSILLCLGLPLAWWLAGTRSRLKIPIEAVTALPLVLPPTVLGFYLLAFPAFRIRGSLGGGCRERWCALMSFPTRGRSPLRSLHTVPHVAVSR